MINRNKQRLTEQNSANPIPYGFRPIDVTATVLDTPMWRDGTSAEDRYSGEILLTLTALTPLIVGNQQYSIDGKQNELVPQRLDDGRVLIAGSGLKGMLRSALADLLQAPMDKVAEHHYTYRPNLGFAEGNKPKREFRAAIVESVEGTLPNAKVSVKLLRSDSNVVFVRANAETSLSAYHSGQLVSGDFHDLFIESGTGRSRLKRENGKSASLRHYVYHYAGGIDGEGIFAEAFSETSKTYKRVLVAAEQVDKAQSIPLSESILRAYHRTQEILADDHHGHLAPGHPLNSSLDQKQVKKALLRHSVLVPQQLIYLEIEHRQMPNGNKGIGITSMGHHFQYRWAYSSSIQRKKVLFDVHARLRPELSLNPEEIADEEGAPKRLSGARLLFGYTLEGRNREQEALATGNFKRLAGRISFNTAIETPEDKTMKERFVKEGQPVRLQILGMPRPSAVEFYLKQDQLPGRLRTYGDQSGDVGGELAGRKYYRHQPAARNQESLYALGEAGNDQNTEDRGTLVRYLSREDSEFRCTLRFDGLRLWELGALLAALEPQRLAESFGIPPSHSEDGYANKLGYGKPLGLGSIRLRVDSARWRKNDSWEWQHCSGTSDSFFTEALQQLHDTLESAWGKDCQQRVQDWLKTRRWKQRGRANYPQKEKRGESTIFNFHSDIRRRYAQARRSAEQSGNFSDLKTLLDKE